MSVWIKILEWGGTAIANLRRKAENRSEALDRLINESVSLGIDKLLYSPKEESDDDSPDVDPYEFTNANDVLRFLSKVCYQKAIGIIGDGEFQFFKGIIECALKNNVIHDWIINCHAKHGFSLESSPYQSLFGYCKKAGICDVTQLFNETQEIEKKEDKSMSKQSTVISTNESMSYRTHLDVLNGIFGKGLLSHMRGVSPLDENTYVWFPHIFKDKNAAGDRLWFNTISADGNEIRETCADTSKLKTFFKQAKGPKRYVFAKMHDGSYTSDYKFMGVYEFKRGEEGPSNEFCWVYERTAVSFKV